MTMTFSPPRPASLAKASGARAIGNRSVINGASVDPAGRRDVDGPRQVRRRHPAARDERQLLPSRDAGRERRAIVGWDPDQDDAPAGPDRRDRVGQGRIVAGDLEGHVDRFRAEGFRAGRRPVARRDEGGLIGAEAAGGRDSMSQTVGRHDAPGPREPKQLDQQQPKGPAAIDAGSAAHLEPAEIDRVDRHAERLEQCRLVVPDRERQPVAESIRPGHRGAQRSVRRPMAGEPRRQAQVRPPRGARTARPARVGRVHGDPLPGARTADDHGAELMAEHQRPAQPGIPDPTLPRTNGDPTRTARPR